MNTFLNAEDLTNLIGHIQKVGPKTRDFWSDQRPKTRDPSYGLDPRPVTRDCKGGTRDPIHRTQLIDMKPGPETRDRKGGTRDPGYLFYMGPKTQDPGQ